jgi:uncharacterized protein YcbK (DUF882 family)
MRIRRLKKKYRLKVWLTILIIFLLDFIFIPRPNRVLILSFFSSKCINYQPVYSNKLNDRIIDYYAQARLTGVAECSDAIDIKNRISDKQLFRVRSSNYYKIENLTNSYPYLTQDSKKLLDEIGERFKKKINREGFKGSRFTVTSMTRSAEKVKGLGRTNINASDNSPHLNGNAFDISYSRFSFIKLHVTECDKWYMKEALAEVIYQLKEEQKCWATYERKQGCFHVVSR